MKLKVMKDGYALFWCPACDDSHVISVAPGAWEYNGDPNNPITQPSIRVGDSDNNTLCHCYLEGDCVRYCNDSPHQYAGGKLPLLDWPKEKYIHGDTSE